MSDEPNIGLGCAVVLGLLLAAPFFIVAIPALAGLAVGFIIYLLWSLFFYAVWKWFFR